MVNRYEEKSGDTSIRSIVAVVLARIVVPLWFLAGAVLKMMDSSPSHLPVPVIKWAGALGIDLQWLLFFNIGVELAVVGVMWFLPSLARPVGLLMLGAFLPILIAELFMGASSCGCFGAVQVHPGITLSMDLGFFLGLWLWGRGVPALAATSSLPTWRVLIAGLWTVFSFALPFGITPAPPDSPSVAEDERKVMAVPPEGYYLPQYDQWIGVTWDEVPLSAWIQGATDHVDDGAHYLLFYRKDCEHCHELMEVFFVGPLAIPTTAVAVPERNGFPDVGLQEFACDECGHAELPAGVDWFLSTPVLVRLLDGVVECAAEVTADDPKCVAM